MLILRLAVVHIGDDGGGTFICQDALELRVTHISQHF
jgi:hypothetical protein